MAKRMPHPLQCFKMIDFFQTEVDDFDDGHFRFISMEEKVLMPPHDPDSGVLSVDDKGFIIKTHCYNLYRDAAANWHGHEFTILVAKYELKPWCNHYKAERLIAAANGCSKMCAMSLDGFIEWIDLKGGKRCEPAEKKFVEYQMFEENAN